MHKTRTLLTTLGKSECVFKSFQVNFFSNKANKQIIISSNQKDIDIPNVTIPEYIFEDVHKWSDKIAVECGVTGKKYTYDELRINSKRLASTLLNSGLNGGDIVTLLLPNMPEYMVSYFGVLEAGFTLSAVNPIYSPDEIVHQMKDSGSRYLICHYDTLQTAMEVKKVLHEMEIVCVNDFDGKSRELPSGVRPFSDLIIPQDVSALTRKAHPVKVDETTAFLPYSSGTTGLPKGVCLTHKNLVANVAQIVQEGMSINEQTTKDHQDTVVGVIPLFHIYGATLMMSRSLREGCRIVTMPKFEPTVLVENIAKNKDVVLYAAPPIIIFLGSHPSVTPKHLENLKVTMTGGAPCSDADLDKLFEKKRHELAQGYGMTELSPVVTHTLLGNKDRASIGTPVANTLTKVIDTKTSVDLPIGETGELCFKGPQVMKCYHKKPEATAETIDEDGWLRTGDIGYINEEKNCFIVDRKKELIKVKGFQVPPAELEGILRQHPKLYDAGVTSRPCPKKGEVPVAFVVPKPGTRKPDEKEIRDFVASKVAPYKQISNVVFIDAIPKNASGKILRRVLKEMVQQN